MNYYDYIAHYGVPGMKKGKRRWTNPDGTLNEAGKQRYKDGKVPHMTTITTFDQREREKLRRRHRQNTVMGTYFLRNMGDGATVHYGDEEVKIGVKTVRKKVDPNAKRQHQGVGNEAQRKRRKRYGSKTQVSDAVAEAANKELGRQRREARTKRRKRKKLADQILAALDKR